MASSKSNPLKNVLSSDTFPGLLLMVVALVAFVWANTSLLSAYEAMKAAVIPFPIPALHLDEPLEFWVNDLLMAVFFLYVGLELKREALKGELSNPRGAALSIFAALGGMVVPALLYAVLNAGRNGSHGWGVPMATDIAFAVGVLSLLGKRIPPSLKIFLTALAVVDDLGAVVVIALFYTNSLNPVMLLLALAVYAALWGLNAFRVRALAVYLLFGVALWYFVLQSGLHATIAGVLLATTIPMGKAEHNPLETLEHAVQPLVGFFVMPVFALFNAGVPVAAALAGGLSPISLGAFFGLAVGKPLGIITICYLAVRTGLAELPRDTSWSLVFGVGLLGGIGFTMALFIATLAFKNPAQLEAAKLGVVAGSVVAALVGSLWLRFTTGPRLETG